MVAATAIPAGAQAPTTFTPSVGDTLIFTIPLRKSATTTVGKLYARGTVVSGGRRFSSLTVLCDGAYRFRNDTTYVSTVTALAGSTTLGAVTGGTGDYAGANGTFESKSVKRGSNTTITLLP